MANIDYGNSLETAGQFPLDGKLRFKWISDMKVIGTNAYKYYEDMVVHCLEDHKDYIWRERLESDNKDSGVLTEDFTYPSGAFADNIDYSGRKFNFFEIYYNFNQDNKTRVIEIPGISLLGDIINYTQMELNQKIIDAINEMGVTIKEDENIYINFGGFIFLPPIQQA